MPTTGFRGGSATLEEPLPFVARDNVVEELLLGAPVVEVVVDDVVAERRARDLAALSSAAIASRSVDGKRSASETYALPSSAGPSSSLCSIPCSPAAISAANARYGLTSPPGIRVSTRNPRRGRRRGTRRSGCRGPTRASSGPTSRPRTACTSSRWVRRTARARARTRSGRRGTAEDSDSPAKALSPSARATSGCGTTTDPVWSGFAMKVIEQPFKKRDLLRSVLVDRRGCPPSAARPRSGS